MPLTERLWALPPALAQNVLVELDRHLRTPEGEAGQRLPRAALGSAGRSDQADKGYIVKNRVAVINVSGPITRRAMYSWWSNERVTVGQDFILSAVETALADSSVRSILLNINSPGGVVAGTKELADRVAEAAKIKPMAAYADGWIASAAMWLASATGRVLAPVTAQVGSIGVILVHADFSKWNEKVGVSYSYITGGRFKAAGNENTPLSDEDRALFQNQVSEIHKIFKADVVHHLSVKAPEEEWAEGQMLMAEEARALGLVDVIVRDVDSAVTLLSQEANMDYQTLAAQHPDLLAEIETKAKAGALAEAETKAQAGISEARAQLMAMVKAVAGEDVSAKIARLAEAGISPAQLEAVLGAMPPAASAPDTKQAILQGLQAATPAAVPGGLPPAASSTPGNRLIADAERRAVAKA
ncbi:MAG: S49 family peptidase [Candidatus Adiutrix sp.]|jgi:signal peptide peptidase SppA|nr:S49 family peptidase [Candidatus Adiutrix sp.]